MNINQSVFNSGRYSWKDLIWVHFNHLHSVCQVIKSFSGKLLISFSLELINVLKNLIARGLHENALELLKVIPRNHVVNSERVSVPEVEFMRQLVLSIQVR